MNDTELKSAYNDRFVIHVKEETMNRRNMPARPKVTIDRGPTIVSSSQKSMDTDNMDLKPLFCVNSFVPAKERQFPVKAEMLCSAGYRPPIKAGDSPPYGSVPENNRSSLSVHRELPAKEDSPKRRELPVRLDDAIHVAMRNRLEVLIASKQKDSEAYRINVAKGKFLPRLDVSGTSRYVHAFDKFSGIEADAVVGDQLFHVSVANDPPKYQLNASIDLTYNLFSGGKDKAALEESVAEHAAQQHEEDATRARILEEVTNAYWALLKSQILVRIAERSYQYSKKVLSIAETKRSSGLLAEIDAETEALHVKEAEYAVNDARHGKERNLEKYRVSLGLPDAEFTSVSMESVTLTDDPEKIGDEELPAGSDRPETLRLKSRMIAAEARVKKAKAAYLPSIDLFSSYKVVGRDDSNYFKSAGIRNDDFTVGATVSFNLFDGFKDRNLIAIAESDENIMRLRVEQTIGQLDAQNKDKMIKREKLRKEVILAEQRVKLSGKKKQLAEGKYRNGKMSEIELWEVRKNYDDYMDNLLISKIEVALAKQ